MEIHVQRILLAGQLSQSTNEDVAGLIVNTYCELIRESLTQILDEIFVKNTKFLYRCAFSAPGVGSVQVKMCNTHTPRIITSVLYPSGVRGMWEIIAEPNELEKISQCTNTIPLFSMNYEFIVDEHHKLVSVRKLADA